MNVRKTITTSAIALGVLAGSAGIASALSSSSPADQSTPAAANAESDQIQEPTLDGSIKADEVEGQSEAEEAEGDEGTETDGVDHQFEGEETGNNGDGVADADDADEADEAPETTPAN